MNWICDYCGNGYSEQKEQCPSCGGRQFTNAKQEVIEGPSLWDDWPAWMSNGKGQKVHLAECQIVGGHRDASITLTYTGWA